TRDRSRYARPGFRRKVTRREAAQMTELHPGEHRPRHRASDQDAIATAVIPRIVDDEPPPVVVPSQPTPAPLPPPQLVRREPRTIEITVGMPRRSPEAVPPAPPEPRP